MYAIDPDTTWQGQAAKGDGGGFQAHGWEEAFGVANGISTGGWTFMCDVRLGLLSGSGVGTIFAHNQSINPLATSLEVNQIDGKVAIIRSDMTPVQSLSPLESGRMHRCAIVVTKTDILFYIDGALEASSPTPAPYQEDGWGSPTRIPSPYEPFDGIVDGALLDKRTERGAGSRPWRAGRGRVITGQSKSMGWLAVECLSTESAGRQPVDNQISQRLER